MGPRDALQTPCKRPAQVALVGEAETSAAPPRNELNEF